jgi:hypothetical protein
MSRLSVKETERSSTGRYLNNSNVTGTGTHSSSEFAKTINSFNRKALAQTSAIDASYGRLILNENIHSSMYH